LLQKKQLNPPNENADELATKKGRFSSKVVSNAESFTTARGES
jgi:hypothetical protein